MRVEARKSVVMFIAVYGLTNSLDGASDGDGNDHDLGFADPIENVERKSSKNNLRVPWSANGRLFGLSLILETALSMACANAVALSGLRSWYHLRAARSSA
jgi:hypothetical protein